DRHSKGRDNSNGTGCDCPPRPVRPRLPVVRFHRELLAWLGALFLALFAFLTAIAIAYFLKEPGYALFGNPWMVCALISFVAAFACFFGVATGWHPPAA